VPGTRSDEVERKYAVDPGTQVPDLTAVSGVAAVGTGEAQELLATYFDTEDLDLLRNGVTLRRRVGGSDEGWHLKEPGGRDRRTETRLPLGLAAHTVPEELREHVAQSVGDAPLRPVATVATHRVEHLVSGPDGERLAVLCVDDVHSQRLLAPRLEQRWVEWEVELVDAPHELLDRLEPTLRSAGAGPAEASSKVARALAVE
jgi:inorganic triphosphatase YgiF